MTSRATRIELDAVVQESEWGTLRTHLTMSTKSLNGLIFFVDNFSEFDNCLIRSSAADISVLLIIGPQNHFMKTSFVSNHARTQGDKIWAADASGFVTCAYSIKGYKLSF
jgi:hypothetical protein